MSEYNHKYTKKEETLNIATHAFGLVLSIVAFPFFNFKIFAF